MKLKNTSLFLGLFISLILSPSLIAEINTGPEDNFAIDQEYVNLARNFRKEGDKEKAIKYFKKAARLNPQNRAANFELGGMLYNEEKFDDSITYYKQACKADPNCAQAFYNAALCFIQKKSYSQAEEYLKNAIKIKPSYKRAYKQLGSILFRQKKYSEATKWFKDAVENNPESFQMLLFLAKSLKGEDKLVESIEYFERAHQLKPDSLTAMLELANTYNMVNRTEESLELYKKILEINPSLIQVMYNYAYTLKKLGKVEESIKYYKQVLEKKPDYATARFSMSLAYLALGDFEKGWEEYEWRWAAYKESPKKYPQPTWDGSNPAGKTIFLYAEQGLGDTYQFIRYAQVLKSFGATVIVEVQKPLVDILSQCEYIDKVVPRRTPTPKFDYHLPLMSFPLAFKTTVNTVPANIPYLRAKPELVEEWKEKLSGDKNFKIGLCWHGNPHYRTQALRHTVAAKSMHVSQFEPLSKIPGVSLYCLQKMGGEEQLADIKDQFVVHQFGPNFDKSNGRFMDTAAVMKNLDLIITVDTSICHLAGGLGVPVWIMLPEPADWRWMLKTDKTPWYPHARLFRQKKCGDWEGVISDIANELYKLFEAQPRKDAITPTKTYKPKTAADSSSVKTAATERPKSGRSDEAQKDGIVFSNMEEMVFEEILDKLIILKLKYESSNDVKLLDEVSSLQQKIKNLEPLYSDSETSIEIEELTEQLIDVNQQLLEIEQNLSNQKSNSIFDNEFINLTRKAHHIHRLKTHIKKQIKELVRPKSC